MDAGDVDGAEGQRPSAWISWEEARATMLGWSGYGILAATADRGGE